MYLLHTTTEPHGNYFIASIDPSLSFKSVKHTSQVLIEKGWYIKTNTDSVLIKIIISSINNYDNVFICLGIFRLHIRLLQNLNCVLKSLF